MGHRQHRADFGYPLLPFDLNRREYNAELAGGCLLEMGIYPVALAWLFMQRDPVDIQVSAHRAPNGVEDDLAMLFDYGDESDGAVATLGTSFRSKPGYPGWQAAKQPCVLGEHHPVPGTHGTR